MTNLSPDNSGNPKPPQSVLWSQDSRRGLVLIRGEMFCNHAVTFKMGHPGHVAKGEVLPVQRHHQDCCPGPLSQLLCLPASST